MKFKEVKAGYMLHLLDRNSIDVQHLRITGVTQPHVDNNVGGIANLVVDVNTEDGKTYVVIADTECAYPDGKVLATTENYILAEIRAMDAAAEQALKQVEKQKEISCKCKLLMQELDPAERDKKETEERFSKIESKIDKMMDFLDKLAN